VVVKAARRGALSMSEDGSMFSPQPANNEAARRVKRDDLIAFKHVLSKGLSHSAPEGRHLAARQRRSREVNPSIGALAMVGRRPAGPSSPAVISVRVFVPILAERRAGRNRPMTSARGKDSSDAVRAPSALVQRNWEHHAGRACEARLGAGSEASRSIAVARKPLPPAFEPRTSMQQERTGGESAAGAAATTPKRDIGIDA